MKGILSTCLILFSLNSFAGSFNDLLINCQEEPSNPDELIYSTNYSDEDYYEDVPYFDKLWVDSSQFMKLADVYNEEGRRSAKVKGGFLELREFNDRPVLEAIKTITYKKTDDGSSVFVIKTDGGTVLNLRSLKFSEYLGTDTIWEITFIVPTWDGKKVTAKTVRNYCMTYFNAG